MRATLMYGAGDVRVENVPDAHLIAQADALVRVTRAGICGSDLWPYKSMGRARPAGGWDMSSSAWSRPIGDASAHSRLVTLSFRRSLV